MSPMPVVGNFAKALYDAAAPMAELDEANGWGLLYLCGALAAPFEDVYDWIMESDTGEPGWSALVDLARAPSEGLPWIAQLAGVRLKYGMTDADARARIASTDGMKRGGASAIQGAPLPLLTGTKNVYVLERYDPADPTTDRAYRLYVATKPEETTNAAAVLAAIKEQVPAGIVLKYTVTSATSSYEGVIVYNATYAALLANYATYNALSGIATGNLDQIGEQKATLANVAGTLDAIS